MAASPAKPVVGRLAPTPSGELHLGNVLAFGAAWLSARAAGGRLLLRMEDIDTQRSTQASADAIRRDLDWLGLHWDAEVLPQSQRAYEDTLAMLAPKTYYCQCSRKQLRPYGGRYPGFCREAGHRTGSLRWKVPDRWVTFEDGVFGLQRQHPLTSKGDPALRRRDGLLTYTLAVVADDLRDGVTEVVRGRDLLGQTGLQKLLGEALGAPPLRYLHLPLLMEAQGRKLSKSHGSVQLDHLRRAGWSAAQLWRRLLPLLGLSPFDAPEKALTQWPRAAVPTADEVLKPGDALSATPFAERRPTGP
jgi:glutamyl/glutaminyl-tRNA synthetase